MLLADARRHADDLAHHAVRAHKPSRAKRDVGDGNVTTSHEEVRHVARVEAAIGNRIGPDLLVDRVGLIGLALKLRLARRLREMQIDRPGRSACAVGLEVLVPEMVLVEDEVAHKAARLAAARVVRNPLELLVGKGVLLGVGVLDERPVRERDEKAVADS